MNVDFSLPFLCSAFQGSQDDFRSRGQINSEQGLQSGQLMFDTLLIFD